MSTDFYEIRHCPACGLRYPLTKGHPFGERCPSCLGETKIVLKRKITQLPFREVKVERNTGLKAALLDNLRSAWNVGAIFRTADGLGLEKLYLCGITPTPENESVRKTSLGAEKTVSWDFARNAVELAESLKREGCIFIALEQDKRAIPLGAIQKSTLQNAILIIGNEVTGVAILIVGNEVTGVDPGLLNLCEQIVYIPMCGQKRSFNVEVAFGIAVSNLS